MYMSMYINLQRQVPQQNQYLELEMQIIPQRPPHRKFSKQSGLRSTYLNKIVSKLSFSYKTMWV